MVNRQFGPKPYRFLHAHRCTFSTKFIGNAFYAFYEHLVSTSINILEFIERIPQMNPSNEFRE